MADRAGLSRWSSILQAKPRTDFGGLVWLSRGFAKQLRLKRKKGRLRQSTPEIVWRGRSIRHAAATTPFVFSQAIPQPETTGDVMLDLVVRIDVPPVRRRIEMEINAASRHVARLRSMAISRSGKERVLHFRGKVTLDGARQAFVLEARPARQFREWNDAATVAAYGALPFQLLSAKFSPAG
ncbi:hypothetical protein LGH82_16595 [Mesorhizobium sp. PAMC28654]|uniref:hypothetical protein n=1 Tax=Mesorhizobium sp. PAMC28654 TaxID=2880934 RepID=UPI001D0AC116|nr:hypothetical protein [Mesorhizobium sp. PAMC28654]UDL86848.1 hypothetical protein LGH82_16595 [Mesorhizobium sp. PAMC28654]